jgi:predicted ribonuclease YlaK
MQALEKHCWHWPVLWSKGVIIDKSTLLGQIVPLSNKDIGFLPGDMKSKVDPYMAPIWDNLKLIREQFAKDERCN